MADPSAKPGLVGWGPSQLSQIAKANNAYRDTTSPLPLCNVYVPCRNQIPTKSSAISAKTTVCVSLWQFTSTKL